MVKGEWMDEWMDGWEKRERKGIVDAIALLNDWMNAVGRRVDVFT